MNKLYFILLDEKKEEWNKSILVNYLMLPIVFIWNFILIFNFWYHLVTHYHTARSNVIAGRVWRDLHIKNTTLKISKEIWTRINRLHKNVWIALNVCYFYQTICVTVNVRYQILFYEYRNNKCMARDSVRFQKMYSSSHSRYFRIFVRHIYFLFKWIKTYETSRRRIIFCHTHSVA